MRKRHVTQGTQRPDGMAQRRVRPPQPRTIPLRACGREAEQKPVVGAVAVLRFWGDKVGAQGCRGSQGVQAKSSEEGAAEDRGALGAQPPAGRPDSQAQGQSQTRAAKRVTRRRAAEGPEEELGLDPHGPEKDGQMPSAMG